MFCYNGNDFNVRGEKYMLAYTYKDKNKFVLENKSKPVILNDTDAIVKVKLASICSSDIHIKPVSYTHLTLPTNSLV